MKQQCISVVLLLAVILCVQSNILPNGVDDKIAIPNPCPYAIKCAGPCPNGYVINRLGCQTCECNPCKFGQPLYKFPCGQGQGTCSANKDLCKVSKGDNAYCCPNERLGCCPPSPNPALVLCLPSNCKNDIDCTTEQKCCGPCSRCVNTMLT